MTHLILQHLHKAKDPSSGTLTYFMVYVMCTWTLHEVTGFLQWTCDMPRWNIMYCEARGTHCNFWFSTRTGLTQAQQCHALNYPLYTGTVPFKTYRLQVELKPWDSPFKLGGKGSGDTLLIWKHCFSSRGDKFMWFMFVFQAVWGILFKNYFFSWCV